MSNKFILNPEQIEAELADIRARNPNRAKIEELRGELRLILDRIGDLTSKEEKYCNLMMALSQTFDNRIAAVKCMSNQELGEHAVNLFMQYTENIIDEAILNELLDRIGYKLGQL